MIAICRYDISNRRSISPKQSSIRFCETTQVCDVSAPCEYCICYPYATHKQPDNRFKMCQNIIHIIEMDLDHLKQVITLMNLEYTISSPKHGRKAQPGRRPHRRRRKRWGNRHRRGNTLSWPSLTGRASYTSTSYPGTSGSTGGITWKCYKKCVSTLQRNALTSERGGCCTTITPASCCERGNGILTEAQHWSDGASSIQPGSVTLWFLAVSPPEDSIMRTPVLGRIRSCWMPFRHSSMPFQRLISRKPSSSTGNNGYSNDGQLIDYVEIIDHRKSII